MESFPKVLFNDGKYVVLDYGGFLRIVSAIEEIHIGGSRLYTIIKKALEG